MLIGLDLDGHMGTGRTGHAHHAPATAAAPGCSLFGLRLVGRLLTGLH